MSNFVGTYPEDSNISGKELLMGINDEGKVRKYEICKVLSGATETADRYLYVSATGSDVTGDGSTGNPFQTLVAVKNDLKKNIECSITIIFQAGTHVVQSSDFDFSEFKVKPTGLYNGIWITGELELVDDVSMTYVDYWHSTDDTKAYVDDDKRFNFLSQYDDELWYPEIKPIMGNTSNQLLVGSIVANLPSFNKIVKLATIFTSATDLTISLNILNNAGSFDFTYIDLYIGGTLNIKNNSLMRFKGCIITATDNINSITMDDSISFSDTIFNLKGRIYQHPSGSRGYIFNCAFVKALPENAGENTDLYFTGHHLLDVDPNYSLSGFLYFSNHLSCISAGYINANTQSFDNGTNILLDNCATLFEGRGNYSCSWKIGSKLSAINNTETKIFWGKYSPSNVIINMIDVVISGISTDNYISRTGINWVFDFDAGDGNVHHNITVSTDEFDENTKYIDLVKNHNMDFPDIYRELDVTKKVTITNGANIDVVIGDKSVRRFDVLFDVDGSSEFASGRLTAINVDDTDIGINLAIAFFQQTGININPKLLFAGNGTTFSMSFNVGDELVLNVDNNSTIDINLEYSVERKLK